MEEKQFKAMLSLLDDKDSFVYQTVEDNLMNMGMDVIPKLESVWENTMNPFLHQRIENIIQKIQFSYSKNNLKHWISDGAIDLLLGAFWIAKYQYPDLKLEVIQNQIDKIYQDVLEEMPEHVTPLQKIRVINHIFFDIYQLAGNNTNFFAPQNSYINHVLESKKGNPITLAIIYLTIAQRIGLPVFGVNLPKNFILVFKEVQNGPFQTDENPLSDVLFYINPYNKGAVLGKREIDSFLTQQKIAPNDSFYLSCSNDIIIQRLIHNLIVSYEQLGYPDKIEDLRIFEKLFRNPLSDDIPY